MNIAILFFLNSNIVPHLFFSKTAYSWGTFPNEHSNSFFLNFDISTQWEKMLIQSKNLAPGPVQSKILTVSGSPPNPNRSQTFDCSRKFWLRPVEGQFVPGNVKFGYSRILQSSASVPDPKRIRNYESWKKFCLRPVRFRERKIRLVNFWVKF